MEKIIRIYGHFLLDALVVGLLLILLLSQITDEHGNTGMFEIIGARIEIETPNYVDYTDFDTYIVESNIAAPVITYQGSNSILIGRVRLTDYITAVDYAGNDLPVKIISVKATDNTELLVSEDAVVEFTKGGVYKVTVKTADNLNKKTISTINIPVNN